MTKDIIFASIIAVITAVIGIILFDFMIIDEFANIELNLKFELQKKLFTACTPIFLGLFMSNYILNASRIAVDKVMESEYQAYYAAISMPTFIIVLFAGFGFKPLLTNLAISYEKGEMKRFVSILSKTGAMTIAFTILCMLAAYLAGIPVLSFIYNLELSHYRVPLMILLLAGGINAINMIQYYTLTIMRQQKIVFIGYFITFVSSFIISNTFVEKWGIMGAALSYLCLMMLLFGIFVAFISMINRKRYGKNSTFSRIKNKE